LLCFHFCLLIHIGASRYMRNLKSYRDVNQRKFSLGHTSVFLYHKHKELDDTFRLVYPKLPSVLAYKHTWRNVYVTLSACGRLGHLRIVRTCCTRGDAKLCCYPCNENQLDALFILSLFRQPTSTCFGHICSPSSGGILYIYNNRYVLCFLVECWLGWDGTKKHNSYQLLYVCIYIYVYIQYTSWWWATNISETCRRQLKK